MRIKNLRGWRGNKYGAVKTVVDGITFDSKAEAARYQELKLLEKAGEIGAIFVHPQYTIMVEDKRICRVIFDFVYENIKTGRIVIEDVKGLDNPLSRLKRRLFEVTHHAEVDLITANAPAGRKNEKSGVH